MSNFFEYFDSLDKDQFEAAINVAGSAIVLAAPGSGKTRTLVAKALADMEKALVHVITFTVSAATEVEERLNELTRDMTSLQNGLMHVGTLHSYCLGVLRRNGDERELVDETTLGEIMSEVASRLRLRISVGRLAELATGAYPEDAAERHFVSAYQKAMAEHKVISYDGILHEAEALLARQPPLWSARAVFLIDEIQDSSVDDLAVYGVLHASGAEIWMVGDLEQAIFGFRHPQPVNVWKWASKLGPVLQLPNNYRSSRAVVRVLNAINVTFEPRLEIVPVKTQAGEVNVSKCENEAALLARVCMNVARLVETGSQREEIAVLCRTNAECDQIATTLKGNGVPVRARSERELAEQVPMRLWAAFGMYLHPESDWMAKRYLRSIGSDDREAEKAALVDFKPIAQIVFPSLFAIERTAASWGRWMDIMLVPKDEQGWFFARMPDGWEGLTWDQIMLRLFELPKLQEEGKGVTVTTIHMAKGREWRHVLMPFCDQKSYRPKNGMEEERVFFVGASRAIESVTFFVSKTRVDHWKGGTMDVAMCAPLERVIEASERVKPKQRRQRDEKAKQKRGTTATDKG